MWEPAFGHQRLLLPIWPRPQALQPGIQDSTEGQSTPAATGYGPFLFPKRLSNNTSNDDNDNNHNINDNKTNVIRNENENNSVNGNDENNKI